METMRGGGFPQSQGNLYRRLERDKMEAGLISWAKSVTRTQQLFVTPHRVSWGQERRDILRSKFENRLCNEYDLEGACGTESKLRFIFYY